MRKLSRREVINENENVLESNGTIITFNKSTCGAMVFTQTWEGPFIFDEVNDEFLWDIEAARAYWKDLVSDGYQRIK